MWTIHHRRKLHFFSLSQVSAIRGEWRKMTARWSSSTIYHKAIGADRCMLSRQTLLLLLLLVCFIESCQASLIKPVWLCGLFQKLLLCPTSNSGSWFKKASARVENFRYLIDFNTTELFQTSIFLPLVCIYSVAFTVSPSSLKQGGKTACLFGVYRIKEEVNIISITFEPVNHQHNTEKHYCKRLTMPMRQELCDLPLRQRGGKRAKTWRRWEVNCALPASFSKQPLKHWWCFRQVYLTLGGGLMDAVPKVNGKNSIKLHHTAWGELHCFGWFIYWLFLPKHGGAM